jgi:chromosome segregation ATPase
VQDVAKRAEEHLQHTSSDVTRLLEEQKEIEQFYVQKYDNMVCSLKSEQSKAVASVQAKKQELDRSLAKENEKNYGLMAKEKEVEALQSSLDAMVSKLESVKSEMHTLQESNPVTTRRQEELWNLAQVSPDAMHARARLEAQVSEKERHVAEVYATKVEITKAKTELDAQRAYAGKLEDFVRRLTQGNNLIDAAAKKEAAGILAAAAKLQAARERPTTPPKRPQSPDRDAHSFRRCAACDEYDIRWPPPQVGAAN